ncbi:hypothetical protein DYB32_000020 [Aphanomyces invadans]|uniref:UBA domain-containing protein n=1 Tax=Aphanomyces invadans TaxID=157072 RepID=A0A3R7D839_9STRA|nr:hypothetical protein DYB32_000020 [Aphanomyces invadans]
MLTGDFYHNGKRTKATTLPLFGSKNVPVIDLTVNTTANTLVVCNADTGVQYGPSHALELVAGEEYYPAVSLYRRDDSVSWLSPILFLSELSPTEAVPSIEPTPLAIYCAKQLISVYRDAIHQGIPLSNALRSMVAQVVSNMCLWTSMLDERDSFMDLIEDILVHGEKATTDDVLTLGCFAGQLFGEMIYGVELEHMVGPELKWVQSKLFNGGAAKRTENTFLNQFIDGSCSNLDKTMLRFVGGSALVLRMGGPNLDRAIRGVIASMLFHCGMTVSAESLDVDTLKLPPKALRLIWQKAVELKAWALRYKTSANTTYDEIAAMLTSKVDLLLSLMPCKSEEYVGTEPPSLSRRISMGSKRSGSFDAAPEDAGFPDWEDDLLQAIYGFYKDSDCSVKRIQEVLSSSHLKAVTRVSGLRRATSVLHSTNVAIPVKAAVLLHLVDVLRSKSAHLWHYQHGIAGCPVIAKLEAHRVFEGFYQCITQLLTSGNDDVSWQLVLLDASALRILPEDHIMLASCRVFQALQEILDRTGDSPSLVGLRQATMKVVYLLALQVASEGESDTHINSLSPPHFKRQLSGPQTLSANVFDILYSEMSAAVTSMLEVDTNATYRLDTIGSNSTILGVLSLLQFVSTSVVCQNFLCTPNWLSLFLTTACFGVTEPHTRAMHLLHTLLPLCDPSFLGIDLLFDLTTLACVSTSCRAMPLLEFFLDTAGMAMMPLESSRTQLPRSAESFLSLASESVSVLRMLMVNETWTDLVAQCLTESYNSTVPSKKLGVLAVMGSFPEPLRFGGHVELQDGSRATVVGLNSDKQSVQVQKNTDQTTCTLAVDSVTVVARESLPMAAFPPALVNSILGQTAQLVDSVYFLHHFQVARLIYNEDPSRLIAFVADYPAMALKVFDIGATLTDTNGLLSLPQLEDKSEIIRSAQYTNTYGTIRDAMFPVSQTKAAAAPVDEEAISTHGTARLGFAEGVVCTMKQVSTFDVPVDMDPRAIAWMEALLNHILSLTVSELTQMWATTTTLNSVNLGNVQQAVEKVYGQIQLPEMLQAACAEANEWLSNRDHWGNEWTVHEASIVQFVLAQLTHNQISIEEWSKKCASLKVGSYLCATCECLVADVLSLAIEVMRNADTATPVVTVASILEAMRGDEELGRLLRFHESFLAQQQTVEASPSVPVDKTSDEKLLDVRIQSMITMGFPETWCRRALDESGQDVNAALNWILMNGDLLQETVGVEAPLPTTPPIEVATTTPVNVVVDEGPRTPSVAWSTDSTVEATGPYSTFWNLEDEKATTFTVRCRTGALVGLFSSPSTLRYEIRISDKSIELYYDGAIVCSDAGAFCDELAGVAYWVVHTAEAIYVGQGSHVNVEDSILHWKRTDSDRLDCCSFASSAAVVSVFNISMAHAYAPARDGSTNVTNVVVVAANRSGQDFTFCFCDGQSANQATTELFNVWGADGTRRGFMDAMAQENAAGLLQHASDMARVLRILYARRLGLTILAICRSSLGSIFHNHEQLFVEFVSLVSNRQWISDIAVNQPLQWYLPRKQTSEDVLRPAIQFICATKNPLSSALCAYMQAQMTAFLQNPTALHWTDPAHLKTDVGVRQGADLRFVLLVTQWLLPVSNVIEHSLFRTWTASLASTHLNVQQTALQVLSHLLDQSLAAGDTDALQLYTNLLSFPHLKAVTARLLQAEQENFPVYSQYLQAHVDFLALCDRALQQLDEAARPTAPHFELFFKGAASCIVLNADAVSPPWTAQYSVRPRAGGATAVLANSNSTSIQLRCGKLFDGRPSLAIKTKLNGKLYPFRCSVPDDTWSVVTITASLSAVSVYINGTFAAQVDAPNVYLPLEHIGDTTHGFRGWIANVRYFESQLTSHQVQVLATNDLAQCQREAVVTAATFDSIVPALTAIGHWPLHEGGGSIVRDSLQRFSDVAVQGVEWTRMMDKNTNATATSPIDSQLSAEHLEDHLVFSGTGTFAQHPCGPLGGGWNQPTTKALALRLYSVDQVRLDGVVEVNSTVRCLVQGKAQSDGFVEFSIVARRGGNDDDNAQWMDGVTFHGWHRKGTLKGTWSASITQTIPPRHDPPMYFLPPTTDSVVLSDGGRLAMSVLRKNKKKASVLYMGFGSAGIQQTWASNGIPTSDLTIAAQHEILNRTDGFATVRCNTMVNCGKVYFELTLRTGGLMQLGFVCPDFKPAFSTHGVGDHFGSYAVDGKRHKKWCNVGSVYGGDWSWSAGDVVGAMVDFDNGTVSFSHQGIDLGVAFTEHECPQIKWSNGFFPAGSFSNGEGASFNLGQVPFQYQPPPGYVSVLEAASMPTPGHVELYSHRQKVFEAISSCHRVAQATCPFPRQTISYGVYHWEIQISSLTATDGIRVGVCIEGVNPTLLLGEDRFGWGLCASGKVYHSSTAQRYASVGFVQGDRVGIELNMYKGTLGYYRNRIHLGDAFTNLNLELPMTAYLMANSVGGFVPAVSFFRPQSMVVCLGLKEGRDDIQYVKKNRAFSGQWKQGQREGDGKLHLTHTEGFYMGSWVDNELEGAALWCEPFPLCVPTMYPDVWKRLGFLRAPDHLVCGIRYDVFRRGAVVETGTPLPTAHIVTTNRASPCLKRAQPVPSTSSWYTSIHTCLRFAMAQTSRQPTGPPKQPTTTSISIDGTWQADAHQRFVLIPPSPLYDSVSIAGDLTSAKLESHASSGNHVLFRGNIGISSGVHYWEVGIQACNHGSLFIGIASSQIKPSEGWGDYGFVSYRVRWSQAEGEHLYGRYFSAGDTIGVRFDMEEGTLSFTKDGDDFTRGRPAVIHMGVAFRNLRSQNSSHNLTFVPVVGCSQPGDAFTVKSYKWHSQTKARWPLARLERALDAASVILDDFPNQSIVQHATALYHSFKTMGEFQPRRFWTRGGTRIELTNAMLDRAIARLQGHDRFTLRHGEALVLGEKDGVIWYVIQGEEAAGAWYWTESEIAHLLTINPSEIPSEPWSCVACTMLNDVNLSKCQICDTPHEVPLEETADIDDEMLAYEALIAPPWSDFWNCVQPLVEFNEDQVAARLSALLAWNAHVEWLLPFLDFHGQSVLEGPISRTANKLAHARHLIFKRIKMAFWKDVLAFTTTHTTPPSDEYERPESLREVPVNRILALNEQASFKNSVFGQLYELQRWHGRVFVPCPNAVTGGGMNQDKFVISTNASASHLTFLGKLIGMAARHRIMVPLNCSDLLWKPLVGLAMDRKDLTSVDTMLMRELHDLECLGDAEVEALDPEEVIEYLLRVVMRLGAVLPYALFNLFTPAQFEELVCGSPHIDIDMLQRITVYEGVDATAPHIAFFWNCLEDMNQDQRSAFVNFVLARSRLPR